MIKWKDAKKKKPTDFEKGTKQLAGDLEGETIISVLFYPPIWTWIHEECHEIKVNEAAYITDGLDKGKYFVGIPRGEKFLFKEITDEITHFAIFNNPNH